MLHLRRSFTRWRKDDTGAVLAMAAVAMPVFIGLAALTVDASLVQMTDNRLQAVADGAALAAARQLPNVSAAQTAAEGIVAANYPSLTPAEVTALAGVVVTGNWDGSTFTPSGTPLNAARVDASRTQASGNPLGTFFARMLGDDSVDLQNSAVAIKSLGTELALVLDTTGSMSDDNKIADLRVAAQVLLDILFDGYRQTGEIPPDLHVSVVPYVASVNSGSAYMNWLVDLTADSSLLPNAMTDYDPTTWKGCTRERTVHDSVLKEETPPGTAPFDPYFYPSDKRNKWPDSDGEVGESGVVGEYGPNFGCGAPVMALSQNYTELSAKVGSLTESVDRFGTHTDVGLSWGWRTISPYWRGQWRDSSDNLMTTLPLDYDTPLMSKVVVLMTDGDNMHVKKDYTAYGYKGDVYSNNSQLDTAMLEVCTAMKARNIIVYVVSFGSGITGGIQTDLENCASTPDQDPQFPGPKYFHAPTGSALTAAFQAVGRQVNDVRLVQ